MSNYRATLSPKSCTSCRLGWTSRQTDSHEERDPDFVSATPYYRTLNSLSLSRINCMFQCKFISHMHHISCPDIRITLQTLGTVIVGYRQALGVVGSRRRAAISRPFVACPSYAAPRSTLRATIPLCLRLGRGLTVKYMCSTVI